MVALAGPVLVTLTSALVVTEEVAVEALFEGSGSLVDDETVAVFDTLPPPGVDDAVRTTIENAAEAPAGSVAMLQVIVPVEPAVGVVQAKVGPLA